MFSHCHASLCSGKPPAVIHETLNGYFEEMTALGLYHGRSRDRELARRLFAIPAFAEQGRREIARGLARAR